MGGDLSACLAAATRNAVRTTAGFVLGLGTVFATVHVAVGDELGVLTLDSGHDTSSATPTPGSAAVKDAQARKVERLTRAFDCSRTGFGEGVIPLHAVVRQDGRVRLSSFDDGWATYLGEAPGTLLSVCRR